jgi:hypothetical protein
VIGAAVLKGMVVVTLAGAAWTSCASPQSAGGPNAECFRIEDCQEGLVCVQKKCSRNLKQIEGEAPMGMAGQGGAAPGDGASDAPSNGDGTPSGGAPSKEAAAPATGGAAPSNGGSSPADASPG